MLDAAGIAGQAPARGRRRHGSTRHGHAPHGSTHCPGCDSIALDNARLTAELRSHRDEATRSGARVVSASDAERRRLERDLHDGAQQRLVSLAIQLRRLAMDLAPDSNQAQLLAAAQQQLAASLQELRELASGLHPAVLDRGLEEALMSVASRAPLPVAVTVDLDQRPGAAVEIAAYYLVCESLTNIAKYAGATTATVTVVHENGCLTLEVADDGTGGADPAAGSGLQGLADRVKALGGTTHISSPQGHGTTVRAEIPAPPR